jgi:hypothetical protein
MTKLKVDRLVTLAKYLAPIKEEKFDIDSWGDHDGPVDKNDLKVMGIKKLSEDEGKAVCVTADQLDNACGTTACALGHAATIPEFRRKGLRLEFIFEANDYYNEGLTVGVVDSGVILRKGDETFHDFEAGEIFFGLSSEEAEELFSGNGYPVINVQGAHVSAKIAEILENHGHVAEAKEIRKIPKVKKVIKQMESAV